MTITGVRVDKNASKENEIMLCVSSWGEKYYINYMEYRNYIDSAGGTLTSSMLSVR